MRRRGGVGALRFGGRAGVLVPHTGWPADEDDDGGEEHAGVDRDFLLAQGTARRTSAVAKGSPLRRAYAIRSRTSDKVRGR